MKNSAQVLRIWYLVPFRGVCHFSKDYFMTHERFEDPKILLAKRNIFLLYIDEVWANLVETIESINMLDAKKFPLLLLALPRQAQRMIRIPVKRFYQMVEELDISDRQVVWMFHTWRCGSTVYSQMFNSLPGWTTISEHPGFFTSIYYNCPNKSQLSKFANTTTYKNFVIAMVKFTIYKTSNGCNVFWKGGAHDIVTLPVIAKLFPQHKLLFCYRDVLPSAKSLYRMLSSRPLINPLPNREFFDPRYMLSSYSHVENIMDKKGHKPVEFVFEVFNWAVSVKLIQDHRKSGIAVKALKYEHLVADHEGTIRKLLQHLNINAAQLSHALKDANEDSQQSTPFSQKKLALYTDWVRTKEEVDRCNKVLNELDLPDLDSSYVLPDTL